MEVVGVGTPLNGYMLICFLVAGHRKTAHPKYCFLYIYVLSCYCLLFSHHYDMKKYLNESIYFKLLKICFRNGKSLLSNNFNIHFLNPLWPCVESWSRIFSLEFTKHLAFLYHQKQIHPLFPTTEMFFNIDSMKQILIRDTFILKICLIMNIY